MFGNWWTRKSGSSRNAVSSGSGGFHSLLSCCDALLSMSVLDESKTTPLTLRNQRGGPLFTASLRKERRSEHHWSAQPGKICQILRTSASFETSVVRISYLLTGLPAFWPKVRGPLLRSRPLPRSARPQLLKALKDNCFAAIQRCGAQTSSSIHINISLI